MIATASTTMIAMPLAKAECRASSVSSKGVLATHERVQNTAVRIHIAPMAVSAVVAIQPQERKRRRAVSSTARPESRRVRCPAHEPGSAGRRLR